MKKYFPQNKSKANQLKKTSNVKFHLDDKGRRIFDFDEPKEVKEENSEEKDTLEEIEKNKKEQIKIRMQNKIKNLDAEKSVFKCEKCNLIFTDKTSFTDHLNGKLHNTMVGNTMNIKNSSLLKVREKLLTKKRDRELKHKLNKAKKEEEIKEEDEK
ncbi:MAG: hypothetical protein MJ252_04550 [archaeon]|nr:hypothetical protein [archaeon]